MSGTIAHLHNLLFPCEQQLLTARSQAHMRKAQRIAATADGPTINPDTKRQVLVERAAREMLGSLAPETPPSVMEGGENVGRNGGQVLRFTTYV